MTKEKTIDPKKFNQTMVFLRDFFIQNGYIETYTQGRRSILAACEDPKTISPYIFSGTEYPLPQTGQMNLELDILRNKDLDGVFCVTTSYRDEPNPIEGRHDKIFPMFEFEHKGNFWDLVDTGKELCTYLGFDKPYVTTYNDLCNKYNTTTLEAEHELQMWKDFGDVVVILFFPERTSPFWNMKHFTGELYYKADFIIMGQETFGTAERSTNVTQMRESFETISNGEYAKILFDKFGVDRVMNELNDYFSIPMFDRFGGGIGITRLIRALEIKEII